MASELKLTKCLGGFTSIQADYRRRGGGRSSTIASYVPDYVRRYNHGEGMVINLRPFSRMRPERKEAALSELQFKSNA